MVEINDVFVTPQRVESRTMSMVGDKGCGPEGQLYLYWPYIEAGSLAKHSLYFEKAPLIHAGSQTVENVAEKHAVVMGLKACVLSAPYDVPLWLPDILMALVRSASEPNPIRDTARYVLQHGPKSNAVLPSFSTVSTIIDKELDLDGSMYVLL